MQQYFSSSKLLDILAPSKQKNTAMNKVIYALGIAIAATFSVHSKSDKPRIPETKSQEINKQIENVSSADSLTLTSEDKHL